jgi:cytochrome P450
MTMTDAESNEQQIAAHFTFFQPAAISDTYADLAWMQQHCPVYFAKELYMWCLFRYADVAGVLRLPTTQKGAIRENFLHITDAGSTLRRYFTNIFFLTDDPQHREQYKAIERSLIPLFKGIRSRIQRITDDIFAQATANGAKEIEVVSQFADHVPVRVIGELMGIPSVYFAQLRAWTTALNEILDPAPSPEQLRSAHEAIEDFFALFQRMMVSRREEAEPAHDLITALMNTPLQGDDLLSTYVALFIAAHESVINSISQGVLTLAEHPEQLAALRRDPGLMRHVPDELLRLHAPTTVTYRQLTEPYTCSNGVVIPAQALVATFLVSANRDEAHFPEPDIFDLHRSNSNEHMAFSAVSEQHACIGAPLARVEIMSAIETLLNGVSGDFRITAPVTMKSTKTFRAIDALHLAIEAR